MLPVAFRWYDNEHEATESIRVRASHEEGQTGWRRQRSLAATVPLRDVLVTSRLHVRRPARICG